MPVMADHDDRPAKSGKRLDQRLARIHVEMVGRLVEDQDMRRIARHQRERQPRALPARQLRCTATLTLSPEKPNRARCLAHFAGLRIRQKPLHVLQRRVVGDTSSSI